MSSLPEIRFNTIRAHLGSQTKGFEELVSQIFRLNTESQGTYHRVEGAGGDGGVEAYILRTDGSKLGVQSKFFDKLGTAQWKQIEKSVYAAITNHPELVEYRVAVPLDRTPAQLKNWDAKATEWNRYAASKGLTHEIKFIWQGSSELIGELVKPTCSQLLTYWFGVPQFTDAWMDRVFQLAVENLDKRYSPDEHVNTEAGQELGAFAHSARTVKHLKQGYVHVIEAWDNLLATIQNSKAQACHLSKLGGLVEVLADFKNKLWPPKGPPNMGKAKDIASEIQDVWQSIHREVLKENDEKKEKDQKTADRYRSGPFDYLIDQSEKFFQQLDEWRELAHKYRCCDHAKLLLTGEAGIGKSHVLAAIVSEARKRGQPALLLLGEQFTESSTPWLQVVKVTDWSADADTLLAALNQAALVFGAPALFVIDALNETPNRNLWLSHLNAFASKLTDYPNIRLAVSCRSDFLQLTLPEKVIQQNDDAWAHVIHEGLGNSLFDAVGKYFDHYKVEATHFPPLLAEFANPLFLRVFCEAYQNSRVPDGPISLAAIMAKRIERLGKKLLKDIDCPEDATQNAISSLARAIQENGGKSITKVTAQKLIDDFSPAREHSKSLYTHLKSNNIIVETSLGLLQSGDKRETFVRFAFERFADYFIAEEILGTISDVQDLQNAFTAGGKLGWLNQPADYWKNRGVARALAIAIPERYQRELVEFLNKTQAHVYILEDFLQSIVWRNPDSFTEQSRIVFQEAAAEHEKLALETILLAATIPGHPYNALNLHQRLIDLPLWERELRWTIPISQLAKPYHSKPSEILSWAMQVPIHLISDEQARLAGFLLFWFLGSNFRGLRFRSALAAIRILRDRSKIVAELLIAFQNVNDPYIEERMYAVACGVAMRERNREALSNLASVVFHQVFGKSYVKPNLLLRDYARSILDLAAQRGCLAAEVKKETFYPPYRSKWPRILSEKKFKKMAENREWGGIIHSTQPNLGLGSMYGDFGRYIMQSEVEQFSSVPLKRAFTVEDKDSVFDAEVAQRWILQRAQELGWTSERFKNYDSTNGGGSYHGESETYKTERIGKKYQWIALREFLGLLSDRFYMSTRWGDRQARTFVGPWQLWGRDFDPSQSLIDIFREDDGLPASDADSAFGSYTDPFADTALCTDRQAWVLQRPAPFEPIIQEATKSIYPGIEWFTLWGLYEWKEPKFQSLQLSLQGRLKMFMHLRSWIVRRTDLKRFLSKARALHFWGKGCDLISQSDGWIGEYPWGRQYASLESRCGRDDEWLDEIGIPHSYTVCSVGSSDKLIAPSPQMCKLMGLEWSGERSDFIDSTGVVQMTQLDVATAYDQRPCVVRKVTLLQELEKKDLTIVWGVVGERNCFCHKTHKHIVSKETQFSGIYYIDALKLKGGITRHEILPIPRTMEQLASHP